jgi:hypothetical protein
VADDFLRIIFNSAPVRYRLESRTAIFSGADTATAIDSVVVSATLTATARRVSPGEVSFRGNIEAMTVTGGVGANRRSESLQAPVSLDWILAGDSVRIEQAPSDPGCDQIRDTARDLLIGSFPSVPDSVTRAQTWKRHSALRSCRGGYSIQVGSDQDLRVASGVERNSSQLSIRSESRLTVSGGGGQGPNAATIRGTGSSLGSYVVDPRSGAVLTSNTNATVRIEVDLGYRTDRFVQRSVRSLTRIPQ